MIRHLRTLSVKILAPVLISAALQSTALAWGVSGVSTISQIVVDTADSLIMVFPASGTSWQNPDACGTSSVVIIPMSGNYKDAEAAVLTAYSAGRNVQFGVSGCTYTLGGGNGPLVSYAQLE